MLRCLLVRTDAAVVLWNWLSRINFRSLGSLALTEPRVVLKIGARQGTMLSAICKVGPVFSSFAVATVAEAAIDIIYIPSWNLILEPLLHWIALTETTCGIEILASQGTMLPGICTEGLFFPVLVLQEWLQRKSINHAYLGDLTDASVFACSDWCRGGPLELTF